MKIQFINHASVIIKCGDVKILTDPWYCGSAFNNGWSLLVEPNIDINSLDFNYIWYSHEHPDHFSIEDIKKINEKRKKEITILFQKTPDQKVKSFCINLGFSVMELENFVRYKIGKAEVMCAPVGGFDSWLYVKFNNQSLLNINDCRLETEEEIKLLKKELGSIDVLMTQFSWANWIGNSGDVLTNKRAREMVWHRTDNQINILKPKFIIPFASFIWFSHEENYFCNDNGITVKEFSDKYDNKKVVVMYPEDEWRVGKDTDCSASISKWLKINLDKARPKYFAGRIEFDTLQKSFDYMKLKLKEKNDWNSILDLKKSGYLEECAIKLNDLGATFLFDITKDKLIETDSCPDIKMGSESFNYLMRNTWGRGTLMVNGRFQANYDRLYKFLRQTHIYYGNNIGKTFPKEIKEEEIVNPKCFVFETVRK